MTLMTKAAYGLASLSVVFQTFLGLWFYAFHEFPPAMVEEMQKSADGRVIFQMLWGGSELSNWALAGSYLMYAAMVPAIATAPRWARIPPCVMFAFHMMYAMTFHEARLIAPTPYPTANVVIHAVLSLSVLVLIALPEPKRAAGKSTKSKRN